MLVCDLKAVAEVDHDLFNLFKCHEESFSKWQFLFFSLNWEVQHVAKKKNCEATSGREGRRPHSTQCSFKISCYQTSQCFFLGSVISVTVSLCNLPLSAVGDSVCGFCVFCCSLDTQVHRSHSVGVFHHLASAGALPAQTQQEADLLLLASSCKWCVTALDIVRESEKKSVTACCMFKLLFFSFCSPSSGCIEFSLCKRLLHHLELDGYDFLH